MYKRLLRIFSLMTMTGLLFVGAANAAPKQEETIFEEETVPEVKTVCDIVPVDIPVVEQPIDDPKEETSYYIDIVDGYITDESLKSVCDYVGEQTGVSSIILQSIVYVESNGKVDATGYSNDCGLCQIIPKYSYERMKRLGVNDIYDPYSNVLVCADIIKDNQKCKYGSDIYFVLMAYNMGQRGATKPYESGHISDYAKKVMARAKELGY